MNQIKKKCSTRLVVAVVVSVCFYCVWPSSRNELFLFTQKDPRVELTNLSITQKDPKTTIGGRNTQAITVDLPIEPETSYTVPKKLHFIWMGKHIPEKYQKNILTFVKVNPDYQVHLWTQIITNDLRKNLTGVNLEDIDREIKDYSVKDLLNQEENIGGKSDILRYEIVYRNGGVYFDTDSISLKPFFSLLTYSFVSQNYDGWNNIQNSVFGFPKGSKFLEFVMKALRWNIKKNNPNSVPWRTGPAFFSGAFVKYNDTNIHMIHQKYLALPKSNTSISYQTYDATWIDH
ncbi:inositol phosphoceramide mannosyltransferase 3 [Eurytemora carolleeae]|uniref:inositol phosphoceramide mannosyltransferase 3 n=1 Tax=Eurytemora carolleeae TaxID=1294199 RepID=UPI000C75D38A|nr:inositol phosphoceramide mannosyltransferase 3 [Eurytemora carolleeae]|eukprot:XP_023341973.1 inositol phosphoceramide mannosyltransferase 3-like [Eurytemora affinis]